jgi:amidase/aspartyl-tRNA(Asn)/glutamyl-tRNA(Gln) amidotransferase subunit A
MTFAAWQSLEPAAAARELHDRARTRLRPGQARAVLAWLRPETELADALTEARTRAAGPLAGVPFFAKDLFDVAGLPTLAGSTFLPEARGIPERDSACVAAVRATGAVLAGKTHMHEFAYGITGENAHYGDCEHPHFPGRTTGGSSSGSVAAVAAGIVPLALGSDTGGSVRVPAAFCGLYGFRLTPGDAWIRDAFPLAPTFDTAGWFTADARDLRTTLAALLGLGAGPVREPRGCSLELPGLDAEVAAAFRTAAARLAAPAPTAVAEALRHAFAGALESYNTTVAQEAWQVHAPWAERFRERYSPAVWQRLVRAHALTAEQIASADQTRAAVRAAWAEFFRDYDFLVLPGTPAPAFTKAECTLENRNRLLTLTAPASLGGLPVLTVPVPLAGGLTTGLQIVVRDVQSPAVMWALRR